MNTPNVTLAMQGRQRARFALGYGKPKTNDNSLKLRKNWDQPEK